ncbi:MAG: hypothetical protein J0I48_22485 [Devosia sp.]|nr:hypothetical protein [Devosia sp.]
MTWVVAHLSEIVNIVFAVYAVAALIVKLTPTPKDDAILAGVYKALTVVAGLLQKKPAAK